MTKVVVIVKTDSEWILRARNGYRKAMDVYDLDEEYKFTRKADMLKKLDEIFAEGVMQ